MLLIVEKRIRSGICHAIHSDEIANNKCMKNYNKDKGSPYIMQLDANNLCGWEISEKLPANVFKWKKSKFNENFIKNYDKESHK